MDESIRKSLEEKFNVKPKVEVKAPATEESLHVESETEVKESIADENIYADPEVDKKIMSFFESVNSKEEETQQWIEASNWLMKEYGCTEDKADDVIGNILMSNGYEFPYQGGCIFTILIAITSTLSLYFVM